MEKNLNKEESEQYLKVVTKGSMDDMYDFAYNIGWRNAMRFVRDESQKFYDSTK